jgi:hypothetical protein
LKSLRLVKAGSSAAPRNDRKKSKGNSKSKGKGKSKNGKAKTKGCA